MGAYCVTGLWLSLTIMFTSGVIFSMLSPVWFQNATHIKLKVNSTDPRTYEVVTFGLLRYCRQYELTDVMFKCRFYENLKEMPSIAWIISTIIFAIGSGLFVLSVIFASFGMCARNERGERLRIGIAYIQIIGVGFLSISVLMFPLGLDSEFAREVCGASTTMYMSGECQVAWGYVLGIMAISLTVFCPILAKYSTELKSEDDQMSYSDYDVKSDVVSMTPSSNSKVMTTV